MAINFVENVGGRAKVCWRGAAILFTGLLLACVVVPAAGFQLVLGDAQLVSTTLVVGVLIACSSFGAILGRSLRLPADRLPLRPVPAADL